MNEILLSKVFLKIINMSISASWLLLAVLLIRLVLKQAPKWIRVLLWGFVAIRLVCPFSIESIFSLIPSAETVSPEIMMDWTPEISTGIGSVDTVINPIITQTFAPQPLASANPLQILVPLAGIVWLAGVAAMLLYAAVSYFLLRRKVATAVLLRNNIYQSENVDSPFVLGIVKPKIYLPFRMDDQNLEYVISHEASHIRRKDHWWKPFGFVLLALHWFNPLMWFGYILLCRDIELACDENVIKEMDNESRANYTQALVACSVNRRCIAACPLAFGEVGVKERVKSVMRYKQPAFWIMIAAIVTCVAVAVCFLTDPIGTNASLQSDQYYLQIGTDGVYEIEVARPNASGGCTNADGSAFKKGETVWLEQLDGVDDIRGLRIRALDEKGNEQYRFFVPEDATADQIAALLAEDSWLTIPVQAALPDQEDNEIEKTFLGSIKTYHQNTDGTWQTDGKTYLYRLKITGRMHDAVRDSTFVYLSNLKTITFDQAWKAAGFSSNSADYFSPEDAVLVDWPDADVSQVGGADTASVIIDGKLFLDGAVSDAILAQNAGDRFPDGPINTEAHAILGVESKSGTPLAGQTNHMEEITIYIQYVYNRYTVSDGTLERTGGICTPAMLTFSGDADNYTLKAFWEPQGGSNYAQEIRDRFPAEIANIVLDPQNEIVNTDELENRCLAQAEAYLADHTN